VYGSVMPRKPKSKPDDPAQSKRFIDMAREIGADETAKAIRARVPKDGSCSKASINQEMIDYKW